MLDPIPAESGARRAGGARRRGAAAARLGAAATLVAMRRALTILCLTLSVSGLAASAAAAQARREPRIRAGVTVSGVDVGNLTLAEAQLRLEQTLGPALAQDIVVTVARRSSGSRWPNRIRLPGRQDRCPRVNAGQAAPPLPDGTLPPASAEPSVRFERKPLWGFAKRTGKAVGVPPRNATLQSRSRA